MVQVFLPVFFLSGHCTLARLAAHEFTERTLLEAASTGDLVFIRAASAHGHRELLRTARSVLGQTLLHVAAKNGHLDIVQELHTIVDINATDADFNTPLHLAYLRGHDDVVLFLCALPEIDIRLTNANDQTPFELE